MPTRNGVILDKITNPGFIFEPSQTDVVNDVDSSTGRFKIRRDIRNNGVVTNNPDGAAKMPFYLASGIGGRPCVRLDTENNGWDRVPIIAQGQVFSALAVIQTDIQQNYNRLMSFGQLRGGLSDWNSITSFDVEQANGSTQFRPVRAQTYVTSAPFTPNRPFIVVVQFDGTNQSWWLNGKFIGSLAQSGNFDIQNAAWGNAVMGGYGGKNILATHVAEAANWTQEQRDWATGCAAWDNDNGQGAVLVADLPADFTYKTARPTVTTAGSGSSYAMTAAGGAYTLTGRSATFNRLYGLTASAGSILLTGRAASQALGRSATRATFTLTGRPASQAQIRPATPAAFAVTGGQTSTARMRTLLAGVGLFALTGGAARQAQTRSASTGTLTVTGRPIAQGTIFTLVCGGGSVVVTGRAAARSLGRFGSPAAVAVTGIASAKAVGRQASGSTRTVTGGASARGLGRYSAPAGFTLTGPGAARALNLAAPSTASGTVTGRPTSFASGRFASPGAFVLTGVAAGLRSLRGLTAGPGSFGMTGFSAGYTNSHTSWYTLGASSGQYSVRMFGDGSTKQLPFMKRKRVRFGLSP